MKTHAKYVMVGGGFLLLGLSLLLLLLLPMSFSWLDYDEMAFKRSRTTGTVDTSRVYSTGRYFFGPAYEFKKFKASAHLVHFSTMVFTSDRLEMDLAVSFQYFLRAHQLQQLHATYDILYEPVLRTSALAALKNAAPSYAIREYIRQREMVEAALFKAVRESLGGRCCLLHCSNAGMPACESNCKPYETCLTSDWGLFADVRFFQLGAIGVPTKLGYRFQQVAILDEAVDREQNLQNAIIIRKETEQKAGIIENEANVIRQAAFANSTLLSKQAKTQGNLVLELARRDGLTLMYIQVNITTTNEKAAFDYLRTLRKSSWKRLAVDYMYHVANTGQA